MVICKGTTVSSMCSGGTCVCIAGLILDLANGPTYLADDALGVNDEKTTEGDTNVLDEDAVVLAKLVVLVADQGNVDGAETAILAGNGAPGEQTVLGVGRGESDRNATLAELLNGIAEGDNFSWADECPGHGDEGEDEPLALGGVVREAELYNTQMGQSVDGRSLGDAEADSPSKAPSTTAVTLKSGAGC